MWGLRASPPDDEALHLRDVWRVIVKRKWVVLAVFLIVVVTALLTAFVILGAFIAIRSCVWVIVLAEPAGKSTMPKCGISRSRRIQVDEICGFIGMEPFG